VTTEFEIVMMICFARKQLFEHMVTLL